MMTDGGFNIADLAAIADDELMFDDEIIAEPVTAEPAITPAATAEARLASTTDEDLVFDDEALAALATAEPAPAAETAKPRRNARRGRTNVEAGADAVVMSETPASAEALPTPQEIPASATAKPAVAEEPVGPPAPVPQPDVGPAGFHRRNTLLLAIVILALFTSLLSLGGLIAVGRTLAHAEADRARAEDERSALVRVPEIVKALDTATTKLAIAANHAPANGPPASVADVKQALDELRVAIAQHQPDGLAPLNGLTRDGFTEIGARLDRLSAQISGVRAAPIASRPMSHTDDGNR